MKYFLLTILFTLIATIAYAQQVTLAWEPSPSPNVIGYVLYYGQTVPVGDAEWDQARDVGNVLTTTVDGLAVGEWHFAVTAYSPEEESVLSNIVNFTEEGFVPPNNIHIPVERPATVNITIEVR